MSVNTIRYSTSSLPNSTLIGNVAFGWLGYDYGPSGVSEWYNGVLPPSGGYVIYTTSGSQIISATVANNSSNLILIAQELTGQTFLTVTQSIDYLNNNGYAVADQVYTGNYTYSPNVLSWPSSPTGYNLYNGGFNSVDDGYSNAVVLPTTFETNNQSSTNLYLGTNGYFTIGQGEGGIYNTPQENSNPALMCGNPGDNWLQPGLTNTDGDVQNWYYLTGSDGGDKYYIKNIVYAGTYGSQTTPTSYLINFYRDNNYQWLETRAKSNTSGNAGPYNNVNVSQPSSTVSKVWRGDLNGQNWVYMGTGSVVI